MGKLKTCQVVLEGDQAGCHYSGDVLRGHVHLQLAQPMCIKDVRVKCVGVCRVTWTVAGMDTQLADVTTAEEYYINSHMVLYKNADLRPGSASEKARSLWRWTRWLLPLQEALLYMPQQMVNYQERAASSESERPETTAEQLGAGEHNFRFEFRLPAGAPASMESPTCCIRYWVKVTVRHGRRTDTDTCHVTVNPRLDLNMFPSARESTEITGELPVTSLFSTGTGIRAAVRLGKTGYVSGEIIPVQYMIQNNTSRVIHSVTLELKRVQHCSVMQDLSRRVQQTVVCRAKLGSVGEMATLEGEETSSLRVPKDQLSLPSGCNLMKISFLLVLKVRPCLLSSRKLKVSQELVLGSIPFRQNLPPPLANSPSIPWNSFPPPSYEEVMAKEAMTGTIATRTKDPTRPRSSRQRSHVGARAGSISTLARPFGSDDVEGDPEEPPPYREAMLLLSLESHLLYKVPGSASQTGGEKGRAPPAYSPRGCDHQGRQLTADPSVASPGKRSGRRTSQTVRCGL